MGLVLQVSSAAWHRCRLPLSIYMEMFTDTGLQEKREDVISKCVLSEPKHGEVWQRIAKDPCNASKGIEEILRLVVTELE